MRILVTLTLFLPVITANGSLRRHKHAGISTLSCGMTASPASAATSSTPLATLSAKLEDLELRQAPGLMPLNGAPAIPGDPAISQVNPAVAPVVPPVAPPSLVDPSMPLPNPANPVPAPANPINTLVAPVSPAVAPALNPRGVLPPAAPIAPIIPPAIAPVVPTLTTAITSTRLASPGVTGDFVTTQWVETWIGGTSQTWVPKTITFHFQAMMTYVPPPGKGEIGMGTLTGKTGKTQTVIMGAAPSQAAEWKKGVAAAIGVGIAGMVV